MGELNAPAARRAGASGVWLPDSCLQPSSERRITMSKVRAFKHAPIRASNMIGTDVVNPKGESLGEIKEIVIDPYSGRVAYGVVAFGGFLGMGEKLFAIPFGSFEYEAKKNKYVLDVTKEYLKDAPGFDPAHWPPMTEEQWHRGVYKYYDRPLYWD
jgi:sporulation protein YlmC with PRC-barrel domain